MKILLCYIVNNYSGLILVLFLFPETQIKTEGEDNTAGKREHWKTAAINIVVDNTMSKCKQFKNVLFLKFTA